MYHGYTCIKGSQLASQHYNPERLTHSVKRLKSGAYSAIDSEVAMDEIATGLTEIINQYGPRAVALYSGSFGFPYPASGPMAAAFMQAINSPMQFSSGHIDQPGKPIAMALHSRWNAGPQPFAKADVWMLVGTNPVVSMWGGIPQYNPAKRLHDLDTRSRWRTTQTCV